MNCVAHEIMKSLSHRLPCFYEFPFLYLFNKLKVNFYFNPIQFYIYFLWLVEWWIKLIIWLFWWCASFLYVLYLVKPYEQHACHVWQKMFIALFNLYTQFQHRVIAQELKWFLESSALLIWNKSERFLQIDISMEHWRSLAYLSIGKSKYKDILLYNSYLISIALPRFFITSWKRW